MNRTGDKLQSRGRIILAVVAAMIAFTTGLITERAVAQNSYSCFPTCAERDGRFLTIAGTGISTLAGDTIRLMIATTSAVDTLVLEIYDGETGGHWDMGTNPLKFQLYADSLGDGTGDALLGHWMGSQMYDTAWYMVRVPKSQMARTPSGNYFYLLTVHTPNKTTASSSSFKVRTNGSISLKGGNSFDLLVPMPNVQTAKLLYPNYPSLDTSTYEGTWTLYLDIPEGATTLSVWDGDMDHGSFDGITKDDDDLDTPPLMLPIWAVGTEARHEGIARGNPAVDSLGVQNGDTTTGAPCDDERRTLFVRAPSIYYEIIDPAGNHYVNHNPSGNQEWEQFKISTLPFERTQMDYHAESLPAGIYTLTVHGMDLANLNAFYLMSDLVGVNKIQLVGVDSSGGPAGVLRPTVPDTAVTAGLLFFDANNNGTQNAGENGIPGVVITLNADFDNNGTIDETYTTTTDSTGRYTFTGLKHGSYRVVVDTVTLGGDVLPTADLDGATTAHSAGFTITSTSMLAQPNFGYRRVISVSISGADTVTGSSRQTFTASSPQSGVTYKWTISGAGEIIGSDSGSTVVVESSNFGTIGLKVTATKDGSTARASKNVLVDGIDFALFAYEYLSFRGRTTDTTRGRIIGNVGVNYRAYSGGCGYSSPTLYFGSGGGCGPNGKVQMSDGSIVMADYVSLAGSGISLYDLYANRRTSSSTSADIRNDGPMTYVGSVIPNAELPKVPSFSYGSTNITVSCNGTRTLAPGKYGVITVRDGGTLNLGTGVYNIKSIRAEDDVTINTTAGTKVRIGRDMIFGDDCYVGPANAAYFVVRSDGVCPNYASVDFGLRTEFHGQVFAPYGTIDLGTRTNLTGRFWSRYIVSGYDVNVTFYSPVSTLTIANNSGFQKRKLGTAEAVTGGSAVSISQNYPNPFTATTSIRLDVEVAGEVSVKVFDALGNEVSTLIDAPLDRGTVTVQWNGTNYNGEALPSGTYFYRMQAGGLVQTKSLVLVRQ